MPGSVLHTNEKFRQISRKNKTIWNGIRDRKGISIFRRLFEGDILEYIPILLCHIISQPIDVGYASSSFPTLSCRL